MQQTLHKVWRNVKFEWWYKFHPLRIPKNSSIDVSLQDNKILIWYEITPLKSPLLVYTYMGYWTENHDTMHFENFF